MATLAEFGVTPENVKKAAIVAAVLAGAYFIYLAIQNHTGSSGPIDQTVGTDTTTLGGGAGTTGVSGINPIVTYDLGNASYTPDLPQIAIPGIPRLFVNQPTETGPSTLARLTALMGGSQGCCVQAPATVYVAPPTLSPVPIAQIPVIADPVPQAYPQTIQAQPTPTRSLGGWFGAGGTLVD